MGARALASQSPAGCYPGVQPTRIPVRVEVEGGAGPGARAVTRVSVVYSRHQSSTYGVLTWMRR